MCELLGMSANVPTDICFSFTGLVQRGGGTGPHKDGWGITFYEAVNCGAVTGPTRTTGSLRAISRWRRAISARSAKRTAKKPSAGCCTS